MSIIIIAFNKITFFFHFSALPVHPTILNKYLKLKPICIELGFGHLLYFLMYNHQNLKNVFKPLKCKENQWVGLYTRYKITHPLIMVYICSNSYEISVNLFLAIMTQEIYNFWHILQNNLRILLFSITSIIKTLIYFWK